MDKMDKNDVNKNDIKMIAVGGTKVGILGLEKIFAELRAASRTPSDELGFELVELAGQRNYIPPTVGSEYAKALLVEYRRYLGEVVPPECSTLSIKILGPGCHRCETLTSNVLSALAELGVAADVEHVREPKRIAEYGILATPALAVNGKVRVVGKTLTTSQIVSLLSKLNQDM